MTSFNEALHQTCSGWVLSLEPSCSDCVSLQVTFPLDLDVYDFCTAELTKQLEAPRAALKDWEDKKASERKAAKQQKVGVRDSKHAVMC